MENTCILDRELCARESLANQVVPCDDHMPGTSLDVTTSIATQLLPFTDLSSCKQIADKLAKEMRRIGASSENTPEDVQRFANLMEVHKAVWQRMATLTVGA